MLGVSYLKSNDSTQALKEFLKAEEFEDDDAQLQAALGQTYFLKKAYADSEKHYLKALKLDEDNPKFENNLAALYLQWERWDDAMFYFHKAATNLLFPQAEVAWTGYGYALFRKGEHVKAIDAYMKAIDQNWRYPQAYVRRGEVFYALDKPGKAISDYRQALKLVPDYALAHFNFALSSMKLQDNQSAIEHFNKVVTLRPESDLARQAKSYLLVLE